MKYVFFLLLGLAAAAPERYQLNIHKDYNAVPLADIEGLTDCVVYGTSCNPERDAFRVIYPGVMHNACQHCTEAQKQAAYYYYNLIQKQLPQKYADLRKKFDPENKYYDNFYKVIEQSVNENKVSF